MSNVNLNIKSDLLYILPLSPNPGQDSGATLVVCLSLGKWHTKFRLSSVKGTQVMSSKRNVRVNVNVNLHAVRLFVSNVTYARTDVTSRRNAVCPTAAFAGRGYKLKMLSAAIVISSIRGKWSSSHSSKRAHCMCEIMRFKC